MWPVSLKRALKKVWQYTKKKPSKDESDDNEPTLFLITLVTYYDCEASL